MKKLHKGVSITLKILALYWVILFMTSKGNFLYSKGPIFLPGNTSGIVTCTYITWTGLMYKNFWYSPNPATGIQNCPALEDIANLIPVNFFKKPALKVID